MEKMNDLRDLLKHEIYDLHSAEEQIIKALPAMIEKANNAQLKSDLEQHLQVTKKHLHRLEQIQNLFIEVQEASATEKKGLLARLFKRNHVCKGMKGLIEEGEKIMAEEMSPEVLDAAIIASAQKIEHYEICGYGTAKAFAIELNLDDVSRLLEQTLNEEYEADDLLTALAVGRLNQKAEIMGGKKSASPGAKDISANRSSSSRELPRARTRTKEMEPELVSEPRNTSHKKQGRSKSSAPEGEAERIDSPRVTSSSEGVIANNKNSKSAKSSSSRKATNGRTSASKTKRSR
jgi:ferritin-like metal-binding protein YciE